MSIGPNPVLISVSLRILRNRQTIS